MGIFVRGGDEHHSSFPFSLEELTEEDKKQERRWAEEEMK